MTTIEVDATEYLKWMAIHNYAGRTVSAGGGTSVTSLTLPAPLGSLIVRDVTLELLLGYQHEPFRPPQA